MEFVNLIFNYGYFSHPVRKVTDLGNAAHEKLPKSANDRLSYGNFAAEITYLYTVANYAPWA